MAPTPASVDKRLSAEITEKLLQGWTLSSHHCPETGVPLLRTPKGELYSVRTGQTYAPEALAGGTPGALPNAGPNPSMTNLMGDSRPSMAPVSPVAGIAASPASVIPQPMSSAVISTIPHDGPRTYDRRQVSSAAEQALLKKIDGARKVMDSTDDLDTSIKAATLMAQCATALDLLTK